MRDLWGKLLKGVASSRPRCAPASTLGARATLVDLHSGPQLLGLQDELGRARRHGFRRGLGERDGFLGRAGEAAQGCKRASSRWGNAALHAVAGDRLGGDKTNLGVVHEEGQGCTKTGVVRTACCHEI